MKKIFAALALVGPLWLTACADDDTVVVEPPAQSGAVVVPERDNPDAVVVPRSDGDVKVCPEGTIC